MAPNSHMPFASRARTTSHLIPVADFCSKSVSVTDRG
jgi:hypothetical protein